MTSFPLASVQIQSDEAARELIALLSEMTSQLATCDAEPTLVAECPHKFNDAYEDDFWCAIQTGETFWEQSQFFENVIRPKTTERASFIPDQEANIIESIGAALVSQRIATLRSILRQLQIAGWRSAINRAFYPPRNLAALIVEFGQPWLHLEQVNGSDGDAFAWDKDGFFHVGVMSRFDQAVDRPQIFQFERIDEQHLHRLGARARAYFLPDVRDAEAVTRLTTMLLAAIEIVRAATDVPVALRSRYSRVCAHDRGLFSISHPESYAENLRQREGEYRIQKDGVWPPYRDPKNLAEQSELSDVAKAYHTALFHLEEGGWRTEFGRAFGEEMQRGETLALFINSYTAVLMRDNTAFRVMPRELQLLGTFDYPNCYDPRGVLVEIAARTGL